LIPNTKLLKTSGLISLVLAFLISPAAAAAASQSLGAANSFVVLSSTYTNTAAGTTLNGDLGYTTPPALAPTLNGTSHVADSIYNQAGIDQGNALASLNASPCTFNFAPGAIDLATDITHGPVGVYAPGVYCTTGAASIGGGGTITLTGAGNYIFRINGALTSSANSIVTASGASACDVWWTPTAATTLGANSTFFGTVIDASGITIGSTVTWNGQALAFGGTGKTTTDTISAAACPAGRGNTPGLQTTTPKLPNTGFAPRSALPTLGLGTFALVAIAAAIWSRKTRKSPLGL
jgi:hypothetical protein